MDEQKNKHQLGTTMESNEQILNPIWGGEQLKKVSILANFTAQELADIYRLGQILTVTAKSNIVVEGDNSHGLFLILDGTVSVYKTDINKKSSLIRLAILEKGNIFGELSLFDKAPRSATVVAESNCKLFNLDAKNFDTFLKKNGSEIQVKFYRRCAEEMAERFRKQNGDYVIAQNLLWKFALRKDNTTNEEISK